MKLKLLFSCKLITLLEGTQERVLLVRLKGDRRIPRPKQSAKFKLTTLSEGTHARMLQRRLKEGRRISRRAMSHFLFVEKVRKESRV